MDRSFFDGSQKKRPPQAEPAQQEGANPFAGADAAIKRIAHGAAGAANDLGHRVGGLFHEDEQQLSPEQEKQRAADLAADQGAVDHAGLDPALAARIDKALAAASGDELSLIHDLVAVPGAQSHLADFFAGAHTVIRDRGALYEKWRGLASAKQRISSHKSRGPQFNVPGAATGPILFGEEEDGSGTWLQLEGYRGDLCLAAAPEILPHMVDYLKYKATNRNQSRFGSSEHTDKRPVVLDAR